MRRLATYSAEFLRWAESRRWRNPETGNLVQFGSLPDQEQARIHARWQHHRGARPEMEQAERQHDLAGEAHKLAADARGLERARLNERAVPGQLAEWTAGREPMRREDAVRLLALRDVVPYLDPEESEGPRNLARGVTQIDADQFERVFGFRPEGERGVQGYVGGRWVHPGKPRGGDEGGGAREPVSSWTASERIAREFGQFTAEPREGRESYDVILVAPTTGNNFVGDGDKMYEAVEDEVRTKMREDRREELEQDFRDELDREDFDSDEEYEAEVEERVARELDGEEDRIEHEVRNAVWDAEEESLGVGPVRVSHVLWRRSGRGDRFDADRVGELLSQDPVEFEERRAGDDEDEKPRFRVDRFQLVAGSPVVRVAAAWLRRVVVDTRHQASPRRPPLRAR